MSPGGAAAGPRYDGTEIAVIGMAGRFPGAAGTAELWRNLRDGVDAVRTLSGHELAALGVPPALRADPRYVPMTAQMAGIESFDAPFFGVSDGEAEILDPQHRIWLELAWEALESSGYDPEAEAQRKSIGVFAGASLSTYLLYNLAAGLASGAGTDPLEVLTGNAGDSLATRISYKLNLRGPSFTVQCACSTSLLAVHLACASLQNDECDLALAGAVSIKVNLLAGYLCHPGGPLSPTGRCRAFDAAADGMFFGHGGGVVALRRLSDALADGDAVRAVIRGSAVNNDGRLKVGHSAPSVQGQAEVLTEAWSAAGIDPATLSYIEAHGTGTRMGDSIEAQALAHAFRPHTSRRAFCALGSIKSNIGHLDVASGVAGLIKTILALEHRLIPPTLHVVNPSPEIDFAASPIRLATELAAWPEGDASPRRAGISSFGFGGTNVHLVVEEAPPFPPSSTPSAHRAPVAPMAPHASVAPRAPASPAWPAWEVIPLSAGSAAALEAATDALADHLASQTTPPLALADVAFTLQTGRRHLSHRRALLCAAGEDAAALLRRRDPERVFTGGEAAAAARVAAPTTATRQPLPLSIEQWLAGGNPDWQALAAGARRRRVPLPTRPWNGASYWHDSPGVPRPLGAIER